MSMFISILFPLFIHPSHLLIYGANEPVLPVFKPVTLRILLSNQFHCCLDPKYIYLIVFVFETTLVFSILVALLLFLSTSVVNF